MDDKGGGGRGIIVLLVFDLGLKLRTLNQPLRK